VVGHANQCVAGKNTVRVDHSGFIRSIVNILTDDLDGIGVRKVTVTESDGTKVVYKLTAGN